jgi:hypothetical protein
MTEYFIVSRPSRTAHLRYNDLLDNTDTNWHTKAKALRMRRWRAVKRANKTLRQNHSW